MNYEDLYNLCQQWQSNSAKLNDYAMNRVKVDPAAIIEHAEKLYHEQINKVKHEEYIKNLMFNDFVEKVRSNQSIYCYMENTFKDAQQELSGESKKRSAKNLIKQRISMDFFDNNKDFKITEVICCGLDSYAWDVELEGYGKEFRIRIPITHRINADNISYANGKFEFVIKESSCSYRLLKSSYRIKDVAEFIKEYFNLDSKD